MASGQEFVLREDLTKRTTFTAGSVMQMLMKPQVLIESALFFFRRRCSGESDGDKSWETEGRTSFSLNDSSFILFFGSKQENVSHFFFQVSVLASSLFNLNRFSCVWTEGMPSFLRSPTETHSNKRQSLTSRNSLRYRASLTGISLSFIVRVNQEEVREELLSSYSFSGEKILICLKTTGSLVFTTHLLSYCDFNRLCLFSFCSSSSPFTRFACYPSSSHRLRFGASFSSLISHFLLFYLPLYFSSKLFFTQNF